MFQKEGYALATSNTELSKAVKGNPDKLLGLFHTGNMDGVLDRKFLKKGTVSKFPDQPDLHAGRPFRAFQEPRRLFPDA